MFGINLKTLLLWSSPAACALVAGAAAGPALDPWLAPVYSPALAASETFQPGPPALQTAAIYIKPAIPDDLGDRLDRDQRLAIGLRTLGVKAIFTLQL